MTDHDPRRLRDEAVAAGEAWAPRVDEDVVYRPAGGGRAERGRVTAVNFAARTAFVLYQGDRTAKSTRFADLESWIPMHFAHPTEHVPLCIVEGTCAGRDVECRASRLLEEVDCPECLEVLRARAQAELCPTPHSCDAARSITGRAGCPVAEGGVCRG